MSYVFAILIMAAIFWYVSFPLFRKIPYGQIPDLSEKDLKEQLQDEKLQTFQTIRDLEFEYQMGKLSSEDFHALRKAEVTKGLSILNTIKGKSDLRAYSKSKQTDQVQKDKTKRLIETNFCPTCGKEVGFEDRFCRVCGKKL